MLKLYDMKVNCDRITTVASFELEARAENCRDGVRYLLLSMSPCSSYSYGFGGLDKIHLTLFEKHLADNVDKDKTFNLIKGETIYTHQFLGVFNDEAQKLYGLSFYRYGDSLYVIPETLGEYWYLHWMRTYHNEAGMIFTVLFMLIYISLPLYFISFIYTVFKYKLSFNVRDVLKFSN